jgi:acetoin utilization protein AcuC
MNDVKIPSRLPEQFITSIAAMGYPHTMLTDALHWADEEERNRALDAVEGSIARIRKLHFPILIGTSQ